MIRDPRIPIHDSASAPALVCMREASLRVLSRTARSLATTPGGLRFVPGSRPWLQGLPGGRVRRASGHACVASTEFFA